MKYFSTLPVIFYNDQLSKNLLTRASINEKILNNQTQYHPYVSEAGERLENISYNYYGTTDQHWLISLANKITDPYYDVSLNDLDFENFIQKKYGSFNNAVTKILFYRNNWSSDDSALSIAGYNALPANTKKYWNPILGTDGEVNGYERKKDDTTITTNKIITASISLTGNSIFTLDERIVQLNGSVEVASGVVCYTSNSTISIKHITGNFSNSVSFTVTGQSSFVNGNIISIDLEISTIANNEVVYFSPVTAYEYEQEINFKKRNLFLISNQFVDEIESDIINQFPETQ